MSADLTIDDYLDRLASDAPTPGGGSVAGLVAALAAALGAMVTALTREPAASDCGRQLAAAAESLHAARDRARTLGARDETVYRAYIAATRLPRSNETEKADRRTAVQRALHAAAEVPLQLAYASVDLLAALIPVARHGNAHLLSDARIAVMLADVAVQAALINVRVNLALMKDREQVDRIEAEAVAIEHRTRQTNQKIRDILASR